MSDRSERMKRHTLAELKDIVKSGSLSAAAAQYEILRRNTTTAKD